MPQQAATEQITDTIPVLDLGPYLRGEPGALEATAEQLRVACETIGFLFLSNHGVAQNLVDRVFEEAKRFHDLPLEAKLPLKANRNQVGYMPYKSSVFRASRFYDGEEPDLNAALFLKRDLAPDHPDVLAEKRFRGTNLRPQDLPGFREVLLDYMNHLEALARKLLPLYAVALELRPDYFTEGFDDPMYTVRLSHYPPVEAAAENQFGIAPHSDSSFFTLLAQNKIPGLSIQTRDGTWIDAPALPGTFLVNSGDMLHRWTNERFLSTPHRAFNASGGDRYAIPFFFDCNIDYEITCLPTCQAPDNPPKYPPTSYLKHMDWFTGQIYDHMRSEDPSPGA